MPKAHHLNPKSLENLSPIHTRTTPEQRIANSRKGGLKAAENERKRRTLREIIANIGQKKLPKRKLAALAEKYDIDIDSVEEMSYDVVMIFAQYMEAANGSTEAAKFLRDTSGQAPTQSLQIGQLDATSADMAAMSDAEIVAQMEALEAETGESL